MDLQEYRDPPHAHAHFPREVQRHNRRNKLRGDSTHPITPIHSYAPEEIRTPSLLIRSQALYPVELRAREHSHSRDPVSKPSSIYCDRSQCCLNRQLHQPEPSVWVPSSWLSAWLCLACCIAVVKTSYRLSPATSHVAIANFLERFPARDGSECSCPQRESNPQPLDPKSSALSS